MNIEKNDKYTVIKPLKEKNFTFFFKEFRTNFNTFSKDNLILDLSKTKTSLDELLQFKTISEKQIESGTSFVVINSNHHLDNIPDEIIVVPTFQEAIDMIEMDEMTRDLEF